MTEQTTGNTGNITLDAEDAKLVTLARSVRARTGAPEGAAVRDADGRTYTAATVDLPSLELTALQAAVAVAVSSGATALEAAAVVTAEVTAGATLARGSLAARSLAAVRDLGSSTPVYRANPAGVVIDRWVP